MTFRNTVIMLRRWLEKVSLALWLHPEFSPSRRSVVLGCASLVGATLLAQCPDFREPLRVLRPPVSYAELVAIIRRAFVPRLYVQLYRTSPLMVNLLRT